MAKKKVPPNSKIGKACKSWVMILA